jgi:hypothetical protein
MKWHNNGKAHLLPEAIAVIIYSLIFIYILVFRIYFNIVGPGESELFPVEILTTASIISVIVIIYMIFRNDILNIGKSNILYPCLLGTFFAYYMAESDWLPGRDKFLMGLFAYGLVIGLVFIITLKIIYNVDKRAFLTFTLGILFLILGTSVDAMNDGVFVLYITLSRSGLLEEALELFGSLFFLHTFILLYFSSNKGIVSMINEWSTIIKIYIGSVIVSFGNSFLLIDREGQTLTKIFLGIFIIIFGLTMILIILNNGKMRKPFSGLRHAREQQRRSDVGVKQTTIYV